MTDSDERDTPGEAPAEPEATTTGTTTVSAAARRMWNDDAAPGFLGMELHSAADGHARVTMTVSPQMVNGHGMAHGGFLFLLADTAFGCACNSPGPVTVGAAADIVFVASAREGDRLEAIAQERTRFGRSGVYDVTVRSIADDRVIAEFRGRSRTLRP